MNRARSAQILVGFDGFVDEIAVPVALRRGPGKSFESFISIAEFADRIRAARDGNNANIELVTRLEKIGGNGPILAQALLTLGSNVRYIGAVGKPDPHPLFTDFARKTHAVSLADPGRTTALEFVDGKLMLGKAESLDCVTYDSLIKILGEDGLLNTIADADIAAFVDWTMVPGFTGILEGILRQILPRLPTRERLFFFDLADPAKRQVSELRELFELIREYSSYGRVNLGLNRNEARQVAAAIELRLPDDSPLDILADQLRRSLNIDAVVVHMRDRAGCAEASNDALEIRIPVCERPLVSTGAGDHFNAGYLFGISAGLSTSEAVSLGALVATTYVMNGCSPDLKMLGC
jgi:hypothetical protein